MTNRPRYLLDNRATAAGARFEALAAAFNAWTFGHVATLGLRPGASCWEVGAGGPSVPSWLATHVGERGDVLATDIDVSWMPDDRMYRVEQHDVAADEPPAGPFDLVHARLVLTHVPEHDEALRRMAASVRPGGWLLIEDFDVTTQPLACLAVDGPEQERANAIRAAFERLLEQRGVDLAFGRTLPARLRALGLVDVGADAYLPVAVEAARALEYANVSQLRDALVGAGIPDRDVDRHLRSLAAATIDVATPPLVSAWGRRPTSREGPLNYPKPSPRPARPASRRFGRTSTDRASAAVADPWVRLLDRVCHPPSSLRSERAPAHPREVRSILRDSREAP